MASPSILRIERLNYALAVVTVLVGLFTQDRAIVIGLMAGSALTCLNFFVLRKLVIKWTTDAASGKSSNSSLLMLPKMFFLMGAVALCVLILPLNVIAFTVGYSIFIISIVIEAAYSALRSPNGDSEHSNG